VELADIRVSNVDKKVHPAETPVRLCNYMDVYSNMYVTRQLVFMEGSASPSELERFTLRRGDVIITKDSETPFDIGIPTVIVGDIDRLVCGYHLALIRPKAGALDSVFLAKQLATPRVARYFATRATGSTRYGLPTSAIESVTIPRPPKPEQEKIAEVLITADRAIEQAEALIDKQQRINTGLMQVLLTRGIDDHGSIRSERTHEFKASPIGRIPSVWDVRDLQDVVDEDITYGIVQAGPHLEGGIPYIRTGDMAGDVIEVDKLLRTSRAIAKAYKRSEVHVGDIVFALRATVGKVLPVTEAIDGANLTQGTAKISPCKGVVSEFLLWMMRTSTVEAQIRFHQKGTTFMEVTLSDLRRIKIAIPRSNAEQWRIANVLSKQDALTADYRRILDKLRATREALAQDLLTGRRRVTPLMHAASQVLKQVC